MAKKSSYIRKRSRMTYTSYVKLFFQWLDFAGYERMASQSFSFQEAMMFSDHLKLKKKLSNRSHNNFVGFMRNLFNDLLTREYVFVNPFNRVDFLPEDERTISAYTAAEIELIKSYCQNHDLEIWLVCQFIFYMAIRPAELVQLQIANIDLENKRVVIPGNISKNRKNSVVLIPDRFHDELVKMGLESLPSTLYLFARNLKPGRQKIAPTRLAERFLVVKRALGINKRLYDFKHTGAGMVIQNGATIKDLQLHMRHSDVKVTDEYLRAFQAQPSREFQRNFPKL